ncbi:MAG: TonB family protein [Sphingopyxis sp.]|uniref:energy transducer TonB n=1 Tax=Sphingopyxis sp. TaxID=1908224 RepID=UPI002ABA69EC|nr:TonB family protein [Sphingopyxis sp.]MDZ3830986.1 TonB family protein [Sphingopyxis sp.]
MVYTGRISGGQRATSGAAALLAVAAAGFILARGLDIDMVRTVSETIAAISIPAPPPAPTPAPTPDPAARDTPSGKASAANKTAKAAPVLAPKPKLPPVTPPVAAAPQPGIGRDDSAGATPNPGPGSGAGGRGDGTGAGGSGNGSGAGTRPIWQSGTIRDRDYPRAASQAKVGGDVEVRFTVEPSGRVSGCRTVRSSGDAALDSTTCRLIEERFRFRPATDARGVAVASPYGWRQSWWLERRR